MKINFIKKLNKASLFFLSFLILSSSNLSLALQITEIQFDPKNVTDAQGEWVEVYNDETVSINISDYKLFDGSTDRAVSLNGNSASISPGDYVVIAKSAAGFALDTDNSLFNGKLFIAPMVLGNTSGGQSLTANVYLKKISNGQLVGSLSYTYKVSDEGKTTQLLNGQSGKGKPTPGITNVLDAVVDGSGGTSTTTNATSTATTTATAADIVVNNVETKIIYVTKNTWPTSEKIYVNAGENRIALTGSEVIFSGKVLDSDKKSLSGEYNWSFGDGFSKSGSKEAKHIYKLPGEYTAIFEVSNGERIEDARIYIKVIDPEIKLNIGKINDINFIEITNNNNEEIKLDGFSLKEINEASTTVKVFNFPKNMSILPKRSVRIVNEATGFSENIKEVGLYYLTGKSLINFTNPKYINPDNLASTTATNINATNTVNIISNLNVNNNISNNNLISNNTKKYIKNYVKTYTESVKQNYSSSTDINSNTNASVTKKIFITNQNKTFWQKFKESLGI